MGGAPKKTQEKDFLITLILGGMGSLAVIPTWVVPPAQQVDCFRICYAVVDETLSFLRGGHAAA